MKMTETRALSRIDALADVFRPVDPGELETIFDEYDRDLAGMKAIASSLDSPLVKHFVTANMGDQRYGIEGLGNLTPAIKALDSEYWQRVLDLTDVLEVMPQKRKDEWYDQIRERTTPAFERANVVRTLKAMLDARPTYFAERVDGVFRGLSREHVTNSPSGFNKRMIAAGMYDGYYSHSQCGRLHDLRVVLAKMHRAPPPPPSYMADKLVKYAIQKRRGEWVDVDGGRLRIRGHKKGTVHIEVHPDMAWRLNQVLASLYPRAIPEQHRRRQATQIKNFDLFDRPVAGKVIAAIANGSARARSWTWDYRTDTAIRAEVTVVMSALGGRETAGGFEFDYDLPDVLDAFMMHGVIPDKLAYQFYPTPVELAAEMVELADIGHGHRVLEPSAGQGHIAHLLPPLSRLVEISELHCSILRSRCPSATVECADFMKWSGGPFDRIVMNAPYSERRAIAHTQRAAHMLVPGGVIVSLLPSSHAGRDILPGWTVTWGEPRAFPGTSIEVVIMRAERPR